MQVIEVGRYGGAEVLRQVERPDLAPVDGKVRVRVTAIPVNPTDLSTRAGMVAARTPNATLPIVLGWEFAGELVDPAPGLAVGQRVAGLYPWFTLGDGTGTYSELVLVDPAWLVPLPAGADLVEAATIAMNAQTAAQGLRILALASGQTLLVTGASGAVGGFAVQLAAAAGIQVIAVPSAGDEDYVRALGATELIGRSEDQAAAVRQRYADGVDAVLDAGASGPALIAAVRDGGGFVAVMDPVQPAAERGIHVATVHTEPEAPGLADLIDRWAAGKLRTRIADVLPFEQAAQAHRRLEAGAVRGKLVLTR